MNAPLEAKISECESVLATINRRHQACVAVLTEAERRQVQARRKADEARNDEQEHAQALEQAESAYVSDPSDGNAARIEKASKQHKLAQLRTKRPLEAEQAADAAVAAAKSAVADAAREIEAAEENLAVARDLQAADTETLHSDIAPTIAELSQAIKAAQAIGDKISARVAAAHEATERLRSKGHNIARLAHFHSVAPLLLERAKADPGIAASIISCVTDVSCLPFAGPQKVEVSCNLYPVVDHLCATAIRSKMDMTAELAEFLNRRQPNNYDGRELVQARFEQVYAAENAARTKQEEAAKKEAERHAPGGVIFMQRAREAQARKDAAEQLRKAREEAERKADLARKQAEYQALVEREKDELLRGGAA